MSEPIRRAGEARRTTSESDSSSYRLIGYGIYTIPEASRLTGIPVKNIRRWTLGYYYSRNGERRFSPAVIVPQIDPIENTSVLSFRDVQEVRFLQAFRNHKVSWQTLRFASQRAKERLGHDHPFSTGKFRALAKRILADVASTAGDQALEDIVDNQLVFKKVIAPYLKGLEFERGEVVRWYPRSDKRVVIDPARSFGQPVIAKEGVPTLVLAKAYKAERSYTKVARWYEVDVRSVRAAVEFEGRRKAA